MNKLFTKIVGVALGLTMAIGVGVAVANSREAVPVNAADSSLSFDFTTNPGDWPTASSAGNYTYTISSTDYTFSLGANVYCNSGYLMLKYTTYLGLPAISDYKLTKVTASNSSGCSTSTRVGISDSSSSASYVTGGAYQTWSTQSSSYEYTLTSTSANTMYYLYVTNKNCQLTGLTLEYTSTGGGGTTKTGTTTTVSADGSKTTLDVTASPADTVQLSATVTPDSGTLSNPFVTWSSGSTSVATVSASGLVTAVAKGTARITAAYAGNDEFSSSSGFIDIRVANPNEVDFVFADLATANSWANNTIYSPITVSGVTLTVGGTGTAGGKWFTSDSTYRLYDGNTLTLTPPSGRSITAVTSSASASYSIANDGSSATASITATTKFTTITVTLGAAKVLDTISASITDSEKVWRVNDVVTASDLTVTPHYTDGTDGTPITDGTGVTVTNGTLSITGDNTVNVSYGGKSTTVTVNALSSTVVAWSITGSIGDTVKSTDYNLSGLTLHAWYDLGKTDEASSSVANLYELVADPVTAESSANPDNQINVEVYLKTDTSHTNRLALFEDVAAPIVNAAKGSEDNPYTSSEAVAAVLAYGSSSASSETYYAYGYVKKINGKNLWIVDEADLIGSANEPADTDCLQCYASSNWSDVALGDLITVSGKMQVYNSKAEFSSSAITNKVAETMTISKTVATDTLTINSAFSYSGVVSIDYTHKTDVANANALVTFSGYNMASTGSQTVTISYSDTALGKEASTTYTLNVEYAPVSSVTLDKHNITVEPLSETNFSVSLNSNVDPNSEAEWEVTNKAGSSLNLQNYGIMSTGNLTATLTAIGDSTDSGTLIVTATVGSVSDTCEVTVTGDAYVTFNKDSIEGIVGATLNNSVTVTPVGLGTPTGYTWSIKSGEATDVVNATSGGATSTLTFLKAGSTVLHVVVTDGTDSAEGDINVEVIKSLNSITTSSIDEQTREFVFSDIATAEGWNNSEAYTEYTISPVTIEAQGGGNNGKWYTSGGGSWRMYSGGTVRISADNGYEVTSVTSSPSCSFTIEDGVATFSPSARTDFTSISVTCEKAGEGSTISNTNFNAQKAVIEFAEDFASKMTAVCDAAHGNTDPSSLNTAWSNAYSTFTSKRNGLNSSDQEVFDALIANATASESGDDLQKALASYNYIYAKYHESLTSGDFLHSTSGRGAVQASAYVSTLGIISKETSSTVSIIVVVSLVSLTAIGGYFFLRKRKEQ